MWRLCIIRHQSSFKPKRVGERERKLGRKKERERGGGGDNEGELKQWTVVKETDEMTERKQRGSTKKD